MVFPYDYGYSSPVAYDAAEGVGAFLLVFNTFFYLLMLLYSVVSYVLYSLGTYTLAKRRGIHHPWLAWVPVANLWVLGSISDQYQYVVKGRVRNRRKVLVGLCIGLFAAVLILLAALVAVAFGGVTGINTAVGAGVAVMLLCYAAILALSVIMLVFEYIVLYDLYASCEPGNAVLYLVLTILISVVLPFFVFACRKKDLGMPPRGPATPAQPALQPVEQQEETVQGPEE